MTTAIIIQARTNSSRLPRKALLPLGAGSVLDEVLRRCKKIPGTDVVVCATSTLPEDDAIEAAATRAGATVARGPLEDVLKRYRLAADQVKAEIVMRVTSDCPLIDPEVCGLVLAERKRSNAGYCANNMPPSFPHGLDCEAFTIDALHAADEKATEAYDREHVTPWLRREESVKRSSVTGPGGGAVSQRWTLDYPEDLEFLRAVFALLPPPPAIPSWQQVAALIDAKPELAKINAAHAAR